jgi:hypothetical protein
MLQIHGMIMYNGVESVLAVEYKISHLGEVVVRTIRREGISACHPQHLCMASCFI